MEKLQLDIIFEVIKDLDYNSFMTLLKSNKYYCNNKDVIRKEYFKLTSKKNKENIEKLRKKYVKDNYNIDVKEKILDLFKNLENITFFEFYPGTFKFFIKMKFLYGNSKEILYNDTDEIADEYDMIFNIIKDNLHKMVNLKEFIYGDSEPEAFKLPLNLEKLDIPYFIYKNYPNLDLLNIQYFDVHQYTKKDLPKLDNIKKIIIRDFEDGISSIKKLEEYLPNRKIKIVENNVIIT